MARDMFFVQSENALKLGDVTVFCTFTEEFIDLFALAFLGLAIFLRVFLFSLFIDISVSNGVLFESNSFLLTSRVNMSKQIYQVTVKDL